MNKKIYLIIPLIILMAIMNVEEVRATVTGGGQGEKGGKSTVCSGGFCANSEYNGSKAYGIRMTLINVDAPEKYLNSLDYWANDNIGNYIGNLGSFTYGPYQKYYKYNGKITKNKTIQNVVGKMSIEEEQVDYVATLKSEDFLNDSILRTFINDYNNRYDTDYTLDDFSQADESVWYILVEPIFLVNVYNANYHHYSDRTDLVDSDNYSELHIAGTAKEIINVLLGTGNGFAYSMLDSCSYTGKENYIQFDSGRDKYKNLSGWDFHGPWNVINNFLINPYYDDTFGNINFINKVNLDKNNKCQNNDKKNFEDIKDNNNSGLSKFIVEVRKFGISKTKSCSERLSDIKNSTKTNNQKLNEIDNLYKDFPSYNGLTAYGDSTNPNFDNVKCEVINTSKSDCRTELQKIKDSSDLSNAQKIEKILDLYSIYHFDNLTNFYINYNDELDLSQTYCSSSCSTDNKTDDNNLFSCTTSILSYLLDKNCYYGKDEYKFADLSNSSGSVYCTSGYDISLNLLDDTFDSGMMVWPDSKYLKTINYKYSCSSTFTTNDYSLESEIFNKLFSYKSIKVTIDGYELETIGNGNLVEEKHKACYNGKCYYQWEGLKSYILKFPSFTHTGGSEWWIKYSDILEEKKDEYALPISGLPSGIDEGSGVHSAIVDLTIAGSDPLQFSCNYSLVSRLIPDCDENDSNCQSSKNFNFDFRIIDKNNPFPGINGNNSRYIGSNWCLQYYIGETIDGYLIGDVDGDGIVDENDVTILNTKKISVKDGLPIWVYDFDGDGIEDSDDSLILSKKINSKASNTCLNIEGNQIVKKMITDAKDSNSTDAPMYSFTLTSSDIRAIRNYNSKVSYDSINEDKDLTCNNGKNCVSTFISNVLKGVPIDDDGDIITMPSADSYLCYDTRVGSSKFCSNSINNE